MPPPSRGAGPSSSTRREDYDVQEHRAGKIRVAVSGPPTIRTFPPRPPRGRGGSARGRGGGGGGGRGGRGGRPPDMPAANRPGGGGQMRGRGGGWAGLPPRPAPVDSGWAREQRPREDAERGPYRHPQSLEGNRSGAGPSSFDHDDRRRRYSPSRPSTDTLPPRPHPPPPSPKQSAPLHPSRSSPHLSSSQHAQNGEPTWFDCILPTELRWSSTTPSASHSSPPRRRVHSLVSPSSNASGPPSHPPARTTNGTRAAEADMNIDSKEDLLAAREEEECNTEQGGETVVEKMKFKPKVPSSKKGKEKAAPPPALPEPVQDEVTVKKKKKDKEKKQKDSQEDGSGRTADADELEDEKEDMDVDVKPDLEALAQEEVEHNTAEERTRREGVLAFSRSKGEVPENCWSRKLGEQKGARSAFKVPHAKALKADGKRITFTKWRDDGVAFDWVKGGTADAPEPSSDDIVLPAKDDPGVTIRIDSTPDPPSTPHDSSMRQSIVQATRMEAETEAAAPARAVTPGPSGAGPVETITVPFPRKLTSKHKRDPAWHEHKLLVWRQHAQLENDRATRDVRVTRQPKDLLVTIRDLPPGTPGARAYEHVHVPTIRVCLPGEKEIDPAKTPWSKKVCNAEGTKRIDVKYPPEFGDAGTRRKNHPPYQAWVSTLVAKASEVDETTGLPTRIVKVKEEQDGLTLLARKLTADEWTHAILPEGVDYPVEASQGKDERRTQESLPSASSSKRKVEERDRATAKVDGSDPTRSPKAKKAKAGNSTASSATASTPLSGQVDLAMHTAPVADSSNPTPATSSSAIGIPTEALLPTNQTTAAPPTSDLAQSTSPQLGLLQASLKGKLTTIDNWTRMLADYPDMRERVQVQVERVQQEIFELSGKIEEERQKLGA